MKILQNCGKLEVRQSPIEGYGVFATDDIPANTILEEIPFVLFPRHNNISRGIYDLLVNNKFVAEREKYLENLRINLKFKDPEKYFFKWHPTHQLEGESMFTVLPLGFGPIYNSSNTENNADWKIQDTTFIFRAEKDIKKDEEIKTFYGYFLSEDGNTFNCDLVFNLAFENIGGIPLAKVLRFGALESFSAGLKNPAYIKINALIARSRNKEGLRLLEVVLLQADSKEISRHNFPVGSTLSSIYHKLAEFKVHPAPVVGFLFEFTDSENKVVKEQVVLMK
jgi:hypothetical protein